MKLTVEQLLAQSRHLFECQYPMLSLWQSMSEHFYPERADFTDTRNQGQELADSLIDSYPILARRDLGNSLYAMLREGDWFDITVDGEPDYDGRAWLQWAARRQKQFFDFRDSNFVRATREGDHDYITFGQAVISVELNKKRSGLLFRAWHLRDCAWFEDETGSIAGVHRKWEPTYFQQIEAFGKDRVHPNILEKAKEHPHSRSTCRHMVMPSSMYGDEQIQARFPYVSVWIDEQNQHMIEEVGSNHKVYAVPRFQTISGSPYAYSPATTIALPDARLIQAMTHTLLEAGERYTRPPLIATSQVVRGDVNLMADGITWVDKDYDERFGAALRPMAQDRGGFPIGLELREEIRDTLASAFYLNKLSLPPADANMTAYEVSERMKQYRRENLPLFAPIEAEYSGQICEMSFDLLMQAGLLGSPADIPRSLRGQDIVYKFKSPLTASEEEARANRFAQMREALAAAMELDPGVRHSADIDQAFRDAVQGIGAPQTWLRPEDDAAQRRQAEAQAQAMQAAAERMQ